MSFRLQLVASTMGFHMLKGDPVPMSKHVFQRSEADLHPSTAIDEFLEVLGGGGADNADVRGVAQFFHNMHGLSLQKRLVERRS